MLDLFAAASLIIPGIAGKTAGKDGVLAIILGMAFAGLFSSLLVYVGRQFKKSYYEYMQKTVGTAVAIVLQMLYFVKFFMTMIFTLGMMAQVLDDVFMTEIPKNLFIAIMLLLMIYSGTKGLEVRARTSEMLIYIVLIPVALLFALALPKVEVSRMVPVAAGGFTNILQGGYLCFATFTCVELLLYVMPHVRNKKNIHKKIGTALGFACFIMVALFLLCEGLLTVEGMNQEKWPTAIIMEIVKLPGGFLSRQAGFMLSFWLFAGFIFLAGYLMYLSLMVKNIFPKTNTNGLLIFLSVLSFALMVALPDYQSLFQGYFWYMAWLGIPQGIIIPVFLIMVQNVRKVVEAKRGKNKRVGEAGQG